MLSQAMLKHANAHANRCLPDAYTNVRTYGLTKKVSIRRIPLPLCDRARAHTTISIDFGVESA